MRRATGKHSYIPTCDFWPNTRLNLIAIKSKQAGDAPNQLNLLSYLHLSSFLCDLCVKDFEAPEFYLYSPPRRPYS